MASRVNLLERQRTREEWLEWLARCPHLSGRTRHRYASLLLAWDSIENGTVTLGTHECPCSTLQKFLNGSRTSSSDTTPLRTTAQGEVLLPLGNGRTMRAVRALSSTGRSIAATIRSQPPLQSTDVPIHPARMARLLQLPSLDCVALRWAREDVSRRVANAALFAKSVLPLVDNSCSQAVRIYDDYVLLYESIENDPWCIAEFLGETLEDVLRHDHISPADRRLVVDILAVIVNAMALTGIIWQGFAPRNMFWRDGILWLIDFERVVEMQEAPTDAYSLLSWHKVFFADALTPVEFVKVFGGQNTLLVPAEALQLMVRCDKFEAEYLKRKTLSLEERLRLLDTTLRIETKHKRPSNDRDGGFLFGHQLGHFWGDFVSPATEVQIVRLCETLLSQESECEFVAVMELFEAAMEADISVMMASRMADAEESRYTERLVDELMANTPDAGPAARKSTPDWYEQVTQNPRRLIDRTMWELAAYRCRAVGDPAKWFVGKGKHQSSHRAALRDALDIGYDFITGELRDDVFLKYKSVEDLRSLLNEELPHKGAEFADVLSDFSRRIASHSIAQHDLRYLAFPDSGNALAALAGALLAPLLNQNMIAFDRSAPAATLVEVQVIEWLRELIGYDVLPLKSLSGIRDLGGLWTPGGHLSNHVAMLVALGEHFPSVRRAGLRALKKTPAIVMAGPIGHYSHSDAASHLGLGWDSVIRVETTDRFTTDVDSVRRVLSAPPQELTPFMVIGVAGNCRTTNVDSLDALAEICDEFGVWFHVDACHGGGLLFSARYRSGLLRGIEHADSVAIDPHKGMFTPYPSSYLLLKKRGQLCSLSRHYDRVLEDGCWDLGLVVPFLGSRGFESLRTWFMLKSIGVEGLGATVELRQRAVEYLVRRIEESGLFIVFNKVDLYRCAFVLCPRDIALKLPDISASSRQRTVKIISAFTERLCKELYETGELCFDQHSLEDLSNRVGLGKSWNYSVMCCAPGNPLFTPTAIDENVSIMLRRAEPLADEMRTLIDSNQLPSNVRPRFSPAVWDVA